MDALLIVDIQHAYFKDKLQHGVDGVLERINGVAEVLRNRDDLVIFIQHDGDGVHTAAAHTEGWEIYSGLTIKANDLIISKTLNDAFAHTELNSILRQKQTDRLVVCGWATDFCVDSTVRSAVSLAYNTVVLADCHTLLDRPHLKAEQIIEHHNWLWANLITAGTPVQLLTAQEYLETL